MHEPGEKFTYGLSTDVLGYFVEVLSGKSFNVFLKEKIFDPLSMNDMHPVIHGDITDKFQILTYQSFTQLNE